MASSLLISTCTSVRVSTLQDETPSTFVHVRLTISHVTSPNGVDIVRRRRLRLREPVVPAPITDSIVDKSISLRTASLISELSSGDAVKEILDTKASAAGTSVGLEDGTSEGLVDGTSEGLIDGISEGLEDGDKDNEGDDVGEKVSVGEKLSVGASDGVVDGTSDGVVDGTSDGVVDRIVGDDDGASENISNGGETSTTT